jgi:DNA-binding GntR family transcriptional regulator
VQADAASGGDRQQATRPRLQRSRLSNQIADIIRTEVLSGDLKAGERIGQVQWAERVGASRMPVRDAINQLCAEGILIQSESGSATVADVRVEDINDAWEVNAMVAGMAARRAAERIDAAELEEIERIETEMEAAISSGDLTEAGRVNWRFHLAINRAAHSPQLTALLRSMARMLSPASFRLMEDWPARGPKEHQAILDALRAHDGERAMKLMRAHVEIGFKPTIENLERRTQGS